MNTIKRRNLQFSVFAVAILAIATIATVLAVTYATGPAQAQGQGPGGGTGGQGPGGGGQGPGDDPTPTPPPSNEPLTCGPGYPDANFPPEPAAVVSSGHYALLDAYWLPDPDLGDDAPKTGTLNTNLCPPAAAHKDVHIGGQTVEQTTLTKSDIDLRTTIIHVSDDHKAGVVATNREAGTTKLSLETYEEVRKGLDLGPTDPVPAGTEVYWLRLEDPDLGTDPSDLVLGFSTGSLQEKYWNNPADEDRTFEWEFESWRVLGVKPEDRPHFFTYWEPELRKNGKSVVVWDSDDADTNVMPQGAGEYEHLEWVFTAPGTYVLTIHVKGHVRRNNPGTDSSWERNTTNDTVTSVPRQYVFHVGDLHVNDQPHFGAVRSVTAGATAGRLVGDVIPLYGMDADTLEFDLDGVGHEKFHVRDEVATWSHGARILVSEGANLAYPGADPENPEQAYYDLHLKVSDKHAYENYADEEIDDIIPLRIHVTPQNQPWVTLAISDEHPRAGEPGTGEVITITAVTHGIQSGWYTGDIRLFEGIGDQKREMGRKDTYGNHINTFRVGHAEPGTQRYSVVLGYDNDNPSIQSKKLASGWYPVIWRK